MQKLLLELENLITDVNLEYFPYVVNDIIYVGSYKIVTEDGKFVIRHRDNIFPIARTYTKHGAFAALRAHSNKRNNTRLLEYDRILYTNDIDIGFFKNFLEKSKDAEYKVVVEARLQYAINNVRMAKNNLSKIIFKKT